MSTVPRGFSELLGGIVKAGGLGDATRRTQWASGIQVASWVAGQVGHCWILACAGMTTRRYRWYNGGL